MKRSPKQFNTCKLDEELRSEKLALINQIRLTFSLVSSVGINILYGNRIKGGRLSVYVAKKFGVTNCLMKKISGHDWAELRIGRIGVAVVKW